MSQFFAPETVPIVAVPERTPSSATPAPMPTDQQPMILAAVQIPDGRIAAQVSPNSWGGNQQIVWFVQQDGRWLVDMTSPAADSATGGVSSVDGFQRMHKPWSSSCFRTPPRNSASIPPSLP